PTPTPSFKPFRAELLGKVPQASAGPRPPHWPCSHGNRSQPNAPLDFLPNSAFLI
ncbi:Hypothetical predicted protein, partial [Marmota monax]